MPCILVESVRERGIVSHANSLKMEAVSSGHMSVKFYRTHDVTLFIVDCRFVSYKMAVILSHCRLIPRLRHVVWY